MLESSDFKTTVIKMFQWIKEISTDTEKLNNVINRHTDIVEHSTPKQQKILSNRRQYPGIENKCQQIKTTDIMHCVLSDLMESLMENLQENIWILWRLNNTLLSNLKGKQEVSILKKAHIKIYWTHLKQY